MPRSTKSVVAVLGAWLSLLGFVLFDPWESIRDGVFMEALAAAIPFFVLCPSLCLVAWIASPRANGVRPAAVVCLICFVVLPVTWDFASRLVTLVFRS